MRKIVLIAIAYLLINPQTVSAQLVGGQSALLSTQSATKRTISGKDSHYYLMKRKVIRRVLERYNSPLMDSTDAFVDACIKYDLDCYLLPSIAGLESYFGTQLLPHTNNPFGWGRGLTRFNSWEDSIDTVGKGLREDYINKGLTTTAQIGAKYCEGNTWATSVERIKRSFTQEEENVRLYFTNDAVEL